MSVVDDRQLQEAFAAWEERRIWRSFAVSTAILAILYPLANFVGAPPGTEPLSLRLVFAAVAVVLFALAYFIRPFRRFVKWFLAAEFLAFYIVQGLFLARSGFAPYVVSRAILVAFAAPLVAPTVLDVELAVGTFAITAFVTSTVDGTAPLALLAGPFGSVFIACVIAGAVGAAMIESRRREIRARLAVELGLEERLAIMRTRDRLTGLPNFERFTDFLQDAIASAYMRGARVGVIAIDLDRLHEIDSQYGTRIGNALVVQVARRFEERVRKAILCRIRSDRFVAIVMDADPVGAEELAYEMLERLAQPFEVQRTTIYVTATVGIALYPDDGSTVDALLARCDENVRRARAGSHGVASLVSGESDAYMARMLDLREGVHRGLVNGEFVLFYQPCIDSRTGAMVSAEALLRWVHPKYGMISPAEFIPLLESNGTIASVGEWVLREATNACAQWRKAGDIAVSVNVSLHQFQDAALFARVRSALETAQLPAESLILEITETVAVQNFEYTVRTMKVCRAWGVRFALDDFGTGYSSMRYLKDLPVDEIKIDRSFMDGLPEDNGDRAIVRAIISMAHSRGCTVYAEGVERPEQARWLTEEGCDVQQGTVISPPLAPAEFEKWMASRTLTR